MICYKMVFAPAGRGALSARPSAEWVATASSGEEANRGGRRRRRPRLVIGGTVVVHLASLIRRAPVSHASQLFAQLNHSHYCWHHVHLVANADDPKLGGACHISLNSSRPSQDKLLSSSETSSETVMLTTHKRTAPRPVWQDAGGILYHVHTATSSTLRHCTALLSKTESGATEPPR